MDTLRLHRDAAVHEPAAASLPGASDPAQSAAPAPRYCPIALLASFALLMAGRGRCVNTDMMLGDREYALWQLACARATDDPELAAIAARLCAYFDEPQHPALPVPGTS